MEGEGEEKRKGRKEAVMLEKENKGPGGILIPVIVEKEKE